MQHAVKISCNHFPALSSIVIAGFLALIVFPTFAAPFAYVGDAFGNSTLVIDTATNMESSSIPTNSYYKVEAHPSGDFIYQPVNPGAWSFGSLDVYDTNNNSLVATVPVGVQPLGITVHPSGDFVYVVSKSSNLPDIAGLGIISIVDTSTNTVSATIDLGQDISLTTVDLVVHPSGNILYAGISSAGTIIAIDTSTLQTIGTIDLSAGFIDMAIHPSGQYIYAAGRTLQVIDTELNNVVDSIAINGSGYSVDVSPDGNTIYVANYTNSTVSIVDTNTNMMTATVSTSFPFDLSVHPSGDFVYATGFNLGATGIEGFVSVIDTASNQISDTINTGGLTLFVTVGSLSEPVGGTTTGLASTSVTCTNPTSGQSISINLGSEKTWDCESSGLQVNAGDSIEIVVNGSAK